MKETRFRRCQQNASTRTTLKIAPFVSIALLIGLGWFAFVTTAATITVPAPIDTRFCSQKYNLPTIDNQTAAQRQSKMIQRPSIAQYTEQREAVIALERASNFESDAPELSDREKLANDIVMAAKQEELSAGHSNPHLFSPSQHFFDVMDHIRETKLFKILRKMPKGGILHAHDTAIASVDFLVSVTYREDLWQCNDTSTGHIVEFKFSRTSPAELKANLIWTSVALERSRRGHDHYDAYVRSLFTLRTENPREAYRDINAVWDKFMSVFSLVEPMIAYVPVWRDYYRQSLLECYEDNVQYLEFRGLLPDLYDLDGNTYTPSDNVQMYVDVLKEFKEAHPEFIGSKLIFAPVKEVPDSVFEEFVCTLVKLHDEFPDFVAGFDLVGQEDTSRDLMSFADILLQLPDEIMFFFHAGETNWFGSIDENLIDAVLLGSLRIGHGFALAKHPTLLQLVKERDIAVEVNPLSNQILKLVDDMRNHPAATYFAQNIPMVISCDDPSFFEANPLTDDFFQAFVGIASSRSDLRTLKKLATNSIKYSSLSADEKVDAMAKWSRRWDLFVEEVIENKF